MWIRRGMKYKGCGQEKLGRLVATLVCKLKKLSLMVASLVFLPWALAQTAATSVEAVTSALRNKEFAKALQLLQPALQRAPGNEQLWTLQALAYSGEGHQKEALASFHHALRISPNYLPALEGASQLEYEAGSAAAIPLLQRVLQLRPDDPTGHAMLAVLEYQQGHCQAAVAHFEKAGAMLDSQLDALHAHGICLVRLKQLDKAVAVFQRSAALHPDDHQERQLLASIQLMDHKPQDAVATLGPLLQGNPDPETLDLASTAYEEAGDTQRAVSTLRQAILLEPRNVNLYLDFANISFAHNSFQVGIDIINDGISVQPKAAPLYLARGVLYVQLADYDRAEADFEKSYELDPSQSLSSAAQGLMAEQQNDLDHALATVRAKLARKPNDGLLLYMQADILTQKGAETGTPEFQTALRSAKKAVLLQPTAPARDVLAKLYLQAGQNQDAAEQCRKALIADPKDQTALYRLIQALRKTDNKTEIPDLLKRLAQLRSAAAKEENERNRYKLVEENAQPAESSQP